MPFDGAEKDPIGKKALFDKIITTNAGKEQTYFADVRKSLSIDGWSEYKSAPDGPREVSLQGDYCTIFVIFGTITVDGVSKGGMKGYVVENEKSIKLEEKTDVVITYPS